MSEQPKKSVEQPAAAPIDEPVAAWINYPVKTVDGEFAGYEKPELSFTRPAYGYDITMAEPLYRRAGAPAVAPIDRIDRVRVEVYDILANFGQMPPEEDETWESWYAAAFDMAAEQIMNAFESATPAHWYDDEAIRFFVEHQRHRQALRAKPKANPAPSPADERAAFAEWCERFPEISRVERLRDAWNTARASSANAAGAEGATCDHQWTWADGKCADCGEFVQQPTATAGMTLAERINHVGGHVTEVGCVEFGSAMSVDALIQHALRDLAPAQVDHAQCCDTPSFCSSVRRCTAKDAAPAQAAEPAAIPAPWLKLAPIDDVRECLMDVVSHHDNIVAGFAAQRLVAQEAQDSDTVAYWNREIDVAHRMKAQAERALAAMVQSTIAPADERAAFEAWWVRDVPVRYRSDTLRVLRQSRELDGKYGIGNIAHAWEGWQARASSANETGAEGAKRDVRQLAHWLLTDPQTGESLHFAGPLEPDFLRFSRVKLQGKSGAVWTLSARLEEGYLTAEERLANIKRAAQETEND